jgi:hypothetical protein
MARRLLKQFAAILIGNVLYFFLLSPHLPARAQHRADKLDLGLIVDFWICVVVYGLIELIARKGHKNPNQPNR